MPGGEAQGGRAALDDRVLEFVSKQLRAKRSTLTLDTTLYGDLHLSGDDCDDFFSAFSTEFGFALEGRRIGDHFPPEPYLGPRLLKMMFRRLFVSADPHEVAEVERPTVGELVGWAETAP